MEGTVKPARTWERLAGGLNAGACTQKCRHCNGPTRLSEIHDAYACIACNVWLEERCTDAGCTFCKHRPVHPFRLKPRAQ